MSKPRLLADENISMRVKPSAKDEEVVELAVNEYRVVLTFDKEYGRFALSNQKLTFHDIFD